MRRFAAAMLAFFIALPPVYAGRGAQKPPQDCVMCGKICCCPEACAPLIKKKLEEARAAAHCGKEAVMSCDMPDSVCRLQAPPPATVLGKNESVQAPRPSAFLRRNLPAPSLSKGSLARARVLGRSLPFSDVPVPPPRFHA